MSTRAEIVAQGVASWLQFEVHCGRGHLLSEASLSQPLGQLLTATGKRPVLPEMKHPVLHEASVDFVVKSGESITLAVETKWINGKRDIKQEVLDDLVRLELIHTPNSQTARWFLVAGEQHHLQARLVDAAFNVGGGRSLFFPSVLPATGSAAHTIDISGSAGPWREAWKKTPTAPVVAPASATWPSKIKTSLLAKYPAKPAPRDVTCLIWKVSRMQNRASTTLP